MSSLLLKIEAERELPFLILPAFVLALVGNEAQALVLVLKAEGREGPTLALRLADWGVVAVLSARRESRAGMLFISGCPSWCFYASELYPRG